MTNRWYALLYSVWDRVFTRAVDRRADPEDFDVHAHADLVEAAQDARSAPIQTLRGGTRPPRYPRRFDRQGAPIPDEFDADWPAPPAGVDCWVDTYAGPRGQGFVINYEVDRGGTKYRKSINYGPETSREQDWAAVVDPPLGLTPRTR